ncbi:protein belonging to Uncharacterized protein family UPF0153, partial [Candidatus Magnetomorum sp. HK-1]
MKKSFLNRLYRSSKKKVSVNGSCIKCGSCCLLLNICEEGKWVSTSRHLKKILNDNPEYKRLKITGKNERGTLNFSCTWLNPDNTCKDYNNRLDICRDFPEKMAFFQKGLLPEGCGYEVSINDSFEYVLQKQVKREKKQRQW